MKKIIMISALTIIALTSCKKFLDKAPLAEPAENTFLSTGAEVDLALTGVYSSSYWTEANLPVQCRFDTYTDIGLERGAGFGGGTFDAANGTILNYYTYMYRTVSRANVMLNGMTKAKDAMPATAYNRAEAEAKVLRAWSYLHLIGLFGDVVYYTKPLDPSEYYTLTRTAKATIIDKLLVDMDDAITKLDWQSTQRGRVNKGVAYGIKAKLAMLDGRYQVAIDATNTIIASAQYNLNPSFTNLFTRAGQAVNASKEIMYEMIYPVADANPVSYINLGQGSRMISAQSGRFPIQALVDRYECTDGKRIDVSPLYDPANPSKFRDSRLKATVALNGDTIGCTLFGTYRRCVFSIYNTATPISTNGGAFAASPNLDLTNAFGPVLNGMGTLWYKYSNDELDDMATAKTSFIYMRYAEILSIYAEAKVMLNQLDATVTTAINKTRNRAGLPNVDAAITGSQSKLLQIIRREKIVEFANEGLHLFDMRMWGTGNAAMNTFVYGCTKVQATPAATPTFGAPGSFNDLNDIPDYTASAAQRFKREQRFFTAPKYNLWPIPQRERDINGLISQNQDW
jgi:starch-binding outer membrane protein, SusD/RagB family